LGLLGLSGLVAGLLGLSGRQVPAAAKGSAEMMCKLISFMVPEGPPYYANGAAKAITRCETHDWTFEGHPSLMCRIGRIEDAADKAIAKIREAAKERV
jgi:hypothetical protein